MIYPTNYENRPIGVGGQNQVNQQSSECLENGYWVFQLQETPGPAVLVYAGSSSAIVTSSLVLSFCSASGPAGRMLVTVWRRASICSSVSRSSLSSTICQRKKTLQGLEVSLTGWSTPTPTLPWPRYFGSGQPSGAQSSEHGS